jgi:ABC-type Fe3+/spermidine/putrescine transport system ATPase subunit
VDTPKGLYERPRTPYVADFVGKVSLLPARVTEATPQATVLELEADSLLPGTARRVVAAASEYPVGARVQVGVRPEYLEIRRQPQEQNCLAGRVQVVKYVGPLQYFSLQVGTEREVLAMDPSKSEPSEEVLYACWSPAKTLVLSDEG